MNLIKLFGVYVLVLGLAACGEADKAGTEEAGDATEAAATTQDAVVEAVEAQASEVVEAEKLKLKIQLRELRTNLIQRNLERALVVTFLLLLPHHSSNLKT